MWNYSFLLPDFIILGIFLLYYFSQPRIPVKLNRSFLAILLSDLAVLLLDAFASYSLERPDIFSPLFLRTVNLLYFAAFLFRILCFFLFTEAIVSLHARRRPAFLLGSSFVFAVSELFVLSNLFFDSLFSISASGAYAKGPLYNVIYVCAFFYLALSVCLLLFYRQRLRENELLPALGFNLVLIAGYIVRICFPRWLILNLFTLLAIIVIYQSFQNPTYFLEGKSNAFNRRALLAVLEELETEKSPLVVAFVLHNYNELREIYSGAQMDRGIVLISQYLARAFPRLLRFYLHDGRFVLVGRKGLQTDEVRRTVEARFTRPWGNGDDVDMFFEASFAQISPDLKIRSAEKVLKGLMSALKEIGSLERANVIVGDDTIQILEKNTRVKRAVEYAVEQNKVELFLQPLMEAKSHRLVGAEALARIRNSAGELIPPVEFIPVAEKNGRINMLGEQMFEKSCQFISSHDMQAMGIQWINVNLSPVQFLRLDLNDRFERILKKYRLPAEKIHLEITEESMIDYALLQKQIQVMKSTGFQFVLDDYGSGYSNVSRLKHCPFINIKLDMEIVWDYFREKDKILPTLVQTFKQMGFTVTAEGIETKEMADAMTGMGCDYLQGYYFSKPMPAAEFALVYEK